MPMSDPQSIKVEIYKNLQHRSQVIALWKSVFGYDSPHNDPELVIDNKLAIDDQLFFVSTINNIVLGTIMAGYDGHRGWIYSLAVKPEKRKMGIGSKLLHHAEEQLEKRGCVKINLQLLASNETTKAFYKKNGYTTEERISMGKKIKN